MGEKNKISDITEEILGNLNSIENAINEINEAIRPSGNNQNVLGGSPVLSSPGLIATLEKINSHMRVVLNKAVEIHQLF